MLVEDHRMFREALRVPLNAEHDFEILAEAGTGAEALAALEHTDVDVMVLDIALPGANGIEVAAQVRLLHPTVKTVVLSGYADRMYVDEMLKVGALGYVLKSSGADELISAIRQVSSGKIFLSAELLHLMLRKTADASQAPPITILGRRERDVLRLLAKGMSSQDIATELGITLATVKVHRRNIKGKLGIRSTAELTRYAIREGMNHA